MRVDFVILWVRTNETDVDDSRAIPLPMTPTQLTALTIASTVGVRLHHIPVGLKRNADRDTFGHGQRLSSLLAVVVNSWWFTCDSRAVGVQLAEDGVESSTPATDIKGDGIQLVLPRSEKIRLELELVLTRVAMEFDGVSESSSGYNRPAVYEHDYGCRHEHEHEHEHGARARARARARLRLRARLRARARRGARTKRCRRGTRWSRVIDGNLKFRAIVVKKGSLYDADW